MGYYSNNTKTTGTNDPWMSKRGESYHQNNYCFHDNCPKCHGTGIDQITDEMCIHGISCPCQKCSPKC